VIVKRQTLAKRPALMAVIVLVGALTGCASQPRQPALTPDQWKSCADEELMIAYTASKVAPSSSKLWWQIAGQQIASECGTGGLAPAGRAAHILDAAEAMEQDFGRFVRELEARSGDVSRD